MQKYIFLILLLILKFQSFAQWNMINEGYRSIQNIKFFDQNRGWISGYNTLAKTTDGGETWITIPIEDSLDLNGIEMTSDKYGWSKSVDYSDSEKKLYRTSDGGLSWLSACKLPYSQNEGEDYSIDAIDDKTIFISGNYIMNGPKSFITRSTDGGKTWTEQQFTERNLNDVKAFNTQSAIAVGRVYENRDGYYKYYEVSVIRTNNGGLSWDETILNDFTEYNSVSNLQYLNDSTAYFRSEGRIFTSSDSGKTWSELYKDGGIFYFTDPANGYIIKRIASDSLWISKSSDGGQSWENVNLIIQDGIVQIVSNPDLYFFNSQLGFIIYEGDVYKTSNGGKSWSKKIFTYPFTDVFFLDSQRGFIGGQYILRGPSHAPMVGDVFYTDNGGKTWKNKLGIRPIEITFKGTNGLLLSNRTIYKTSDFGENWETCYTDNFDSVGYSFSASDISIVNDTLLLASGTYNYADSSGAAILGSSNGGENWDLFWTYPDSGEFNYWFNSIYTVNNMTWIVGNDGLVIKTNNTVSFNLENVDTDLPLRKVFFSDQIHGWISGGYYNTNGFQSLILKTINGGQIWTQIHFNKYLISDLYFADSLHGWAAGRDSSGHGFILSSEDGADSWITQVEGLSAPINAIHFTDGYGWAVGGNGLILRTEDGSTWIDQNTGIKYPNKIALKQNYPNPFNPSTNIEFQIPNSQFTTLKVYDLLGREVTTLVSSKLNPGNHTFKFDGRNLASGIYYYQLAAGKYREVKKMILLK